MEKSGSNINYKSNQLTWNGFPLLKSIKDLPTPFFLYSEETLEHSFLDFKNAAIKSLLPNPLVAFAVKANGNQALLKILAQLGSGADIVSGGELEQALRAGITPDKIVFSGVGKTKEEMTKALLCGDQGIYSFNVESLDELSELNALALKLKRKARVALRLNPEIKPKTHKYISTGHKTHKFGILKNDLISLLENRKKFKGIHFAGLSVHIGSQLLDLKATLKAVDLLGSIAAHYFPDISFLDVGGGLGVAYHPSEKNILPSCQEYMEGVKLALDRSFFVKHPHSSARVVFEPGRRIVATSGLFIMKVLRSKKSDDFHFTIVDGGMNDFARPALYGAYHELLPLKKNAGTFFTQVVGPICETTDCFGERQKIPVLKSHDLIGLKDAGAYGYSMASNYNQRGKPAEYLLTKKGKIKLIKAKQQYEII